ncbi:D-glycero-alpha-D-manno-heptose-1,7-bisphosphate 7-phosphatase [Streptomyces sp. NPDC054770]
MAGSRRAVFLDRDGVLNADRPAYVRSRDDVELLAGAAAAVGRLADAGLAVVVVTNQQAVGKGVLTLEQAVDIQRHVLELLRRPHRPDPAWYLCPHLEREGCPCRKPAPGMLLRAARDLGLDLGRSVLVGDALTDLQAARRAGVSPYLVLTGRGRTQRARPDADLERVTVLPDLPRAADDIVRSL